MLPGNAAIHPFVVCLGAQAANKDGILALFAHLGSQAIHQPGAESCVIEGLDIIIHIFLVRSLMGNYNDTGIHGLLQHRIKLSRVHRHDAERVHTLCDQVFDDRNLLGGIGFGRPYQGRIDALLCAPVDNAFFHAVEPVDPGNFDNGHKVLILCGGRFFSRGFSSGRLLRCCWSLSRWHDAGRQCKGSDEHEAQEDIKLQHFLLLSKQLIDMAQVFAVAR